MKVYNYYYNSNFLIQIMLEILITKIVVFVLCFAIFDVIREIMAFVQCYRKLEVYKINNKRMLWLWASISFIVTIIFTGIL